MLQGEKVPWRIICEITSGLYLPVIRVTVSESFGEGIAGDLELCDLKPREEKNRLDMGTTSDGIYFLLG